MIRSYSLISKRGSAFFGIAASVAVLTGFPLGVTAAERTDSSMPVDREALTLAQELLSQAPARELVLEGVFKIRHADGRRSEVPVGYRVRLAKDHWESIYQTRATAFQGPEQLVIQHHREPANRYLFAQVSFDGSRTNSLQLTGSEAALSFAGTDFWLTDLGLEFLHWPEQRLIRDAKITMRWGRPTKVLESISPEPTLGGYSRVVSWIDAEMGALIYAEAYDASNRRYKVFSLKGFKKVDGRWQVREMELRNDRADSRTRLEFVFETD